MRGYTSSGFKHDLSYVALDSDLVITFAQMYYSYKMLDGRISQDLVNGRSYAVRNNFKECEYMFRLIIDGKVRPLITNSIFNEVSGSVYGRADDTRSVLQFMRDLCYAPKPNMLTSKKKKEQIQVLAKHYCLPYVDEKGVKREPPMKFAYNAFHDTIVPENDAVAMAEATIYGCMFLTYNGRDFVWRRNTDDRNQAGVKIRTIGILQINRKCGYEKISRYVDQTPKPMYLVDFVHAVQKVDGGIEYFDMPEPDDSLFTKLDTQISEEMVNDPDALQTEV